jgi:enoyl-CoA hydratase/carnithine racemase
MEERMTNQIEPPVLFEERLATNGRRIGFATLNAPKSLNGLSLDMARLLDARLADWANDDEIAVVVLQAAGEKAFCAGGDLRGLYDSMLAYREAGSSDIRDNAYAREFFLVEYRLDYRIHTYPKPILVWGHGIVMGGGIGLMAGASHRVVTERSKLAMPEITVGLFPDVGGSWILKNIADRMGLFLALTGAPLSATDALYVGLADHAVLDADRAAVFDSLIDAAWSDDAKTNADLLDRLLEQHSASLAPGPLQNNADAIKAICAHADLEAMIAAIQQIQSDDAWLSTAKATLAAGAPGSARLAYELQNRAASLSLADTFRMEYVAALHAAARGDFFEGIRALLIDKDRNPRWNPASAADASAEWAAGFVVSPWSDAEHPLVALGISK